MSRVLPALSQERQELNPLSLARCVKLGNTVRQREHQAQTRVKIVKQASTSRQRATTHRQTASRARQAPIR